MVLPVNFTWKHGFVFQDPGPYTLFWPVLFYPYTAIATLLSITFNTMGYHDSTGCRKRILAKEQRFWQYRAKLVVGPGAHVPILSIPVSAISHFSLTLGSFRCQHGIILHCFHAYFFYTKNLFLRLFYLIVGMAGFYGLLISGNPIGHAAVPIAGLGLFLFLV